MAEEKKEGNVKRLAPYLLLSVTIGGPLTGIAVKMPPAEDMTKLVSGFVSMIDKVNTNGLTVAGKKGEPICGLVNTNTPVRMKQ